MHYFVGVITPITEEELDEENESDESYPENEAEELLERFNETAEIELKKVYLDAEQILDLKLTDEMSSNEIKELIKKNYGGKQRGKDKDGYYYCYFHNPNARWDWYEIGGRFDTHVNPSEKSNVNIVRKLHEHINFDGIITPDGQFHSDTGQYWSGSDDRYTDWDKQQKELLSEYLGHVIVGYNLHD